MKIIKNYPFIFCALLVFLSSCQPPAHDIIRANPIKEVNHAVVREGSGKKAVVHVSVIDVVGGDILPDACILIDSNKITAIGSFDQFDIPDDTEIIDASGLYALPGLIDAHFHLGEILLKRFLTHGITTLRDPGAWIESYNNVRASRQDLPRLFLTGPHFDMENPAYPTNCVINRDAAEARLNVKTFADQGASAIKVYFRTSLGLIKEICDEAHSLGLPVTAHLEITDIYEAVNAGLDGLEHITSLGTSLIPKREAEDYKRAILEDNNARRMGRYEMWSQIDFDNQRASKLTNFLVDEQTFICPTLGAFEYQPSEEEIDTTKLEGFKNMQSYTGHLHHAGARLVLGSHSWTPYDSIGWAYHNEMELWASAGIDNLSILKASTIENARFLRIEDRLGSLEAGKQADIILLKENPLDDISSMRLVDRVMLNGVWLDDQK